MQQHKKYRKYVNTIGPVINGCQIENTQFKKTEQMEVPFCELSQE